MINTTEKIKDVLDIFHDGEILKYSFSDQVLILDVEISYLAKRIKPDFSLFYVILHGCQNVKFETWPNEKEHEVEILIDLSIIFKAKLILLSAEVENGKVKINCSQRNSNFNFCGGFLSFISNSIEIKDEAGKLYSTKELNTLSEEYWDEWEKNSKNKV